MVSNLELITKEKVREINPMASNSLMFYGRTLTKLGFEIEGIGHDGFLVRANPSEMTQIESFIKGENLSA